MVHFATVDATMVSGGSLEASAGSVALAAPAGVSAWQAGGGAAVVRASACRRVADWWLVSQR